MDVAKGGVTRFEKPPEPCETLKEGNFAHRSFSMDSSRGVGVEVPTLGSRCSSRSSP